MDGCGLAGPVVPPGLAARILVAQGGAEGGRALEELLVLLLPAGHVALDGDVLAVDGVEGRGAASGGHLAVEHLDVGAVLLGDGLVEGIGEEGPVLGGVQESADDAADRAAVHGDVRV